MDKQGEVALSQGEIDELVSVYLDAAVTRRDLRALEARLDVVMDRLAGTERIETQLSEIRTLLDELSRRRYVKDRP